MSGLAGGLGTEPVLLAAFAAMFSAAVEVTGSGPLHGKLLLYVLSNPGSLTAFLEDDDDALPAPVPATTAVLAQGQLSGEIRTDEPAESLAVILLYVVLFSTRRSATLGRPPPPPPCPAWPSR